MSEERFETETILRDTTVEVTRPVEVDADGEPVETETVELPASERVEAVTCERYPYACPRDAGLVPTEEAVVVGVDLVDRATGADAAVALAYCPECASGEFDYVRDRDAPTVDGDGRTLHEKYGYLFGDREGWRADRWSNRLRARSVEIPVLLGVLAGALVAIGADWLVVWTLLTAAAAALLFAFH